MKINLAIILTLCIVSTTLSCASLNEHISDDRELKLNRKNLSVLEGEYQIYSTKDSLILPGFLINNFTFSQQYRPDNSDKVVLKFLNKRRIKIEIIQNDNEIIEKISKGKFKNGYFEFSSNELTPFWVIFTGIHKNKIRLASLKDGNLLVDYSSTDIGLFLFFPIAGSRRYRNNIEFKKIIATGDIK